MSADCPAIKIIGLEQRPLTTLVARGKRQDIDEALLEVLKSSLARLGQIEPLIIDEQGRVLDGRHRLIAMKELKLATACCVTVRGSEEQLQEAVIAAVLHRRQISILEQSELMVAYERNLIKVEARAKAVQGRPRRDDEDYHPPFTTRDMAEAFGCSERTLQRRLRIAKKICREARNLLRNTSLANNQAALERIAGMKPHRQIAAATQIDPTRSRAA